MGISGSGVVAGAAVVVFVMVECSPCASLIVTTNSVFINSLEPETENEQRDGGIVWFQLSDGFVRNAGFSSIRISTKNRNWELVANAPSLTSLYD